MTFVLESIKRLFNRACNHHDNLCEVYQVDCKGGFYICIYKYDCHSGVGNKIYPTRAADMSEYTMKISCAIFH